MHQRYELQEKHGWVQYDLLYILTSCPKIHSDPSPTQGQLYHKVEEIGLGKYHTKYKLFVIKGSKL